jgi:putative N6-adenine-specific DNA methylase
MCGSGTILIEAALLARRIAPGLVREQFGYMRWPDFDSALHRRLVEDARREVLARLDFPIAGSDIDPQVIAAARANAARAGVERDITWRVESFELVEPPAPTGTLVSNPPYGQRIKTVAITDFYRTIGDVLKHHWKGYAAYLLSGNLAAAKHIGLRTSAKIRLFNGPIECRLLKFLMY